MNIESHIRKLGSDHRAMLMGVAFTNGDDAACALARRFIWESGRVIGELMQDDRAASEALYRIGDIIATNRTLPEPDGRPAPPIPAITPDVASTPPDPPRSGWKQFMEFWGLAALFVFGVLLGAALGAN